MTEGKQGIGGSGKARPENQEAQIFAKITRYIGEQLEQEALSTEENNAGNDEKLRGIAEAATLFREIADAFEQAGGLLFDADQTLPLSQTFALLVSGMKALSAQATEQNQTNAAAKMEWAARKATAFTAIFQQCHLNGTGGEISLSDTA